MSLPFLTCGEDIWYPGGGYRRHREQVWILSSFCSFQVGKDDIDNSKPGPGPSRPSTSPPVNQYSLTVGLDLGPHDTKSLLKCVESLSFIVRDAAHITPDNFELCVKTLRIFVEASLNGGGSPNSQLLGNDHGKEWRGGRNRQAVCAFLLGNESYLLVLLRVQVPGETWEESQI